MKVFVIAWMITASTWVHSALLTGSELNALSQWDASVSRNDLGSSVEITSWGATDSALSFFDTGVVIDSGDRYSIDINFTRRTSDSDPFFYVTDGITAWAFGFFEDGFYWTSEGFSGLGSLFSGFTVLFAGDQIGIGNTGTLELEFVFDVASTTVNYDGTVIVGGATPRSTVIPGGFVSGNTLGFGVAGHTAATEIYQINSVNLAVVPEPSSLALLPVVLVAFAVVRACIRKRNKR